MGPCSSRDWRNSLLGGIPDEDVRLELEGMARWNASDHTGVVFVHSCAVTAPPRRVTFRVVLRRMTRTADRHCCRAAMVAATLAGCAEGPAPRPDEEPTETLRLGRIHLTLRPKDVETTDSPLEISARFAFVRGLEEDFARARIDMPVLLPDLLEAGQCSTEALLAVGNSDAERAEPLELQELILVDAGELSMQIGAQTIRLPLALVPDLLPYMSGVEYLYEGDDIVTEATPPVVIVRAEGSRNDAMPPFSVTDTVPEAIELSLQDTHVDDRSDEALILDWPRRGDDAITLRITPMRDGSIVGEEILCVLEDSGQARLEIAYLRTLGLDPDANALRIDGSRIRSTPFQAGDIANSELVLEHRSRLEVLL